MTKPPTIIEAEERGLLANKLFAGKNEGIHTFSNGDEWYAWADVNCDVCRFYDPEAAGALCAFEAAAFLHLVTPDLARLFGWIESEEYPGSFDAPQECAFLRRKDDRDDGNDRRPPPPCDPQQLVLIADPTEDAALVALEQPVEVADLEEVTQGIEERAGELFHPAVATNQRVSGT